MASKRQVWAVIEQWSGGDGVTVFAQKSDALATASAAAMEWAQGSGGEAYWDDDLCGPESYVTRSGKESIEVRKVDLYG